MDASLLLQPLSTSILTVSPDVEARSRETRHQTDWTFDQVVSFPPLRLILFPFPSSMHLVMTI